VRVRDNKKIPKKQIFEIQLCFAIAFTHRQLKIKMVRFKTFEWRLDSEKKFFSSSEVSLLRYNGFWLKFLFLFSSTKKKFHLQNDDMLWKKNEKKWLNPTSF
jgi:hypothetical protein